MKRILPLALALALCVTIPVPALAASAAKPAPVQVLNAVSRKEYKTADGQVVMTVRTETPVISGNVSEATAERINAIYRDAAQKFLASIETDYRQEAIDEATHLTEIGAAYTFSKTFQLAYNANGLISFIVEDNYYTTGAHSISEFTGETYDLRTGQKLSLDDILSDTSAVMQKLSKKVSAYIKKNGLQDFVSPDTSAMDQFDPSDFVLTPKGIRFFFQQYAIAPFSSGTPSFELTYKELGALRIPAKAAPSNAAENSIREALPGLLAGSTSRVRGLSSYTYALSNITSSKATLTVYYSIASSVQGRIVIPLRKKGREWRINM